MKKKEYIDGAEGTGVLSTADSEGRVDAAIYSVPHAFDDGTLAFIMRERLTHLNLQSKPYAAFLFIEDGSGYRGVRLFYSQGPSRVCCGTCSTLSFKSGQALSHDFY